VSASHCLFIIGIPYENLQAQEAAPEGSVRETGADSASLGKSKRDQGFSWGSSILETHRDAVIHVTPQFFHQAVVEFFGPFPTKKVS